jgi:hypothetical protein
MRAGPAQPASPRRVYGEDFSMLVGGIIPRRYRLARGVVRVLS